MIDVLRPRRSHGLLSGRGCFPSAPMCALLLALPVGMAEMATNAVKSTSASQIIWSAGATVRFHDLAETGLVLESHHVRRMATTTVSPGAGTLQTAINAASAGDVLELADGTYTGSGDNVIEINKDITIQAQNAGQVVIDGENARRVIKIGSGNVVLNGLKITKSNLGVSTNCHHPIAPIGALAFTDVLCCLAERRWRVD